MSKETINELVVPGGSTLQKARDLNSSSPDRQPTPSAWQSIEDKGNDLLQRRVSRRGFLGGLGKLGLAAAGAAILGNAAIPRSSEASSTQTSSNDSASGFDTGPIANTLSKPDAQAELAHPDYYETLPAEASTEIGNGVWWGVRTGTMQAAIDQKKREYDAAGVSPEIAFGLPGVDENKGSFFIKGPDNKFYEFALGARGVAHIVDGQLMRVLVKRDLARGAIELRQGVDYQMSDEAKNIVASRPVTGEPGSQFPSLSQIRNELTLIGAENYAPQKSSSESIGFPWTTVDGYQNGHNTLGIFTQAQQNKAKDKALEIYGYPIGEPRAGISVIKGQPVEIMWQPFERGDWTYNPGNPTEYQCEGGLAGNQFIAALNHGNENLPAVGGEIPPTGEFYESGVDGLDLKCDRQAPIRITIPEEDKPNLAGLRQTLINFGYGDKTIQMNIFKDLNEAGANGFDPADFHELPLQRPSDKQWVNVGWVYGRVGEIKRGPEAFVLDRTGLEVFGDWENVKQSLIIYSVTQICGNGEDSYPFQRVVNPLIIQNTRLDTNY